MRALLAATLLVGACWTMAGCSDAGLILQLRPAPDDSFYPSIEQVQVQLRRDGEIVADELQTFNGQGVQVPNFSRSGPLAVDIEGRNVAGTLIAVGTSALPIPARGELCCVIVCFCPADVFDAGACNCGNTDCLGREECLDAL